MSAAPLLNLVTGLARNLGTGARLALFRPVSVLDFRISPGHLAALFIFNLLVWLAGGMVRGGWPGFVNVAAMPMLLLQVPVLLLAALLIATRLGRAELLLALVVMWIAADWLFEIAINVLHYCFNVSEPSLIPGRYASALWSGLSLWSLAIFVRALWVAVGGWRARLPTAVAITVAVYGFFYLFVPRTELWLPQVEQVASDDTPALSPASEEVFHLQPSLLAEALATVAPSEPGRPHIYFLGVAAFSSQNVFMREVTAVERIVGERFNTRGRALTLINNSETLREAPIATVTNLRAALGGMAELMNRDEDILFLFITTHGDRDHSLSFDLPPLELQQLTPPALARMLHQSRIKWKVVVISACYAGGYIEPLRDANTVVITAARPDRTSFGCEHGRDWTYFGEALFRDAIGTGDSLLAGFDRARAAIAFREAREGLDPSEPQIHIGDAIRPRLELLDGKPRTVARAGF